MNNQAQRPNKDNLVDQAVSQQQPKVATTTTKKQVVVQEPTTTVSTPKKQVVIQDGPLNDDPVANSKLPSNETIDNAMETLKSELLTAKENTPGLNAKGERIVDSAAQVVDSAQAFIQEKNEGDRLQNLILESRQAAVDMKDHAKDTGTHHAGLVKDIDHDRLREMAEKALETARLAGTELVSSNSFRMVLKDFVALLYDAMKGIVVSEEDYKKEQAEKSGDNSSRTDDGSKKKHKKKKSKKSKKSTSVSKNTTESGVHMDERTTVNTTHEIHEETRSGKDKDNTHKDKDSTVKSADGDLKDAAETIETKINRQLSDLGLRPRVRLSKEDLDDLLERFLHILRNISKRESTRKVFTDILDLLRLFSEEVGLREDEDGNAPLKEHTLFTANEVKNNEHLNNSLMLSKGLFEKFTGENTLDPILDHLRAIAAIVREDTQVRDFFEELSAYFRETIDDPSKIDSEDFMKHGRKLIKKFRKFRSQKVYEHIEGIAYQAGLLLDAIRNDPATLRLKDDMKNLIRELAFDADGNFAIKAEVIDQLKLVILNSVVERMKIPLPPLHTKDDKLELHVTNMVVAAKDVVPGRIVVEDIGKIAIDLGNASSPALEKAKNDIKITIEKINVHMTNVDVAFQRFSFPKIADNGVAKLDIGGKGIDLEIHLRTFPGSNQLFRIDKINCDVHSLSLHLDDTRHDALYNTVLKLIRKKIKRNIAKSIEDMLRNQLENLNNIASKAIVHAKAGALAAQDKAIQAKDKIQDKIQDKLSKKDEEVIEGEGQQVPADEVVLKQRKLEASKTQQQKPPRMTTV